MRKFSALLFALPCLAFADNAEFVMEDEAVEESAIEKLFIGMEKELAMADELSDEEAKKLFEEGGIITMAEEELLEEQPK